MSWDIPIISFQQILLLHHLISCQSDILPLFMQFYGLAPINWVVLFLWLRRFYLYFFYPLPLRIILNHKLLFLQLKKFFFEPLFLILDFYCFWEASRRRNLIYFLAK